MEIKFTKKELTLIKRCVYYCVPKEALLDLGNYKKGFSNTIHYELIKKLDKVGYDEEN